MSWFRFVAVVPPRAINFLAYELQSLAPSLAQDGPNPEYPWPQIAPQFAPVSFEFDLWTKLTNSGRGRQLMQVIRRAVDRFPSYG